MTETLCSQSRVPGSTPGQGTRSCMPPLSVSMPQLKIQHAITRMEDPAALRHVFVWVALVVKNPPANAGDVRDVGSVPELGGSSGAGHGNPLKYSCLENPMDRGGCRATIHWVAKIRHD